MNSGDTNIPLNLTAATNMSPGAKQPPVLPKQLLTSISDNLRKTTSASLNIASKSTKK